VQANAVPHSPAPQPQASVTSRPTLQQQAGIATRRPSDPFPRANVAPPAAPLPQANATKPSAPHVPPAITQPDPKIQAQIIADELRQFDTFVVGEVEAWIRDELPALVVHEVAKLNERLRAEAITHLRATLLPRIAEYIAGQIDKIKDDAD
jgi:hypothetical protein